MTAPVQPTGPSPASTAPLSNATVGGPMGKNEFLKLLVAQMTHQDPLNPLDGQEMASQLAQFSSVEQLMSIGEKLDQQSAGTAALLGVVNNSAALGILGRDITVATDEIVVGENGTQSVSVDVPAPGGELTVRITDADGKVVNTRSLGFAGAGKRSIDLADSVTDLPPGTYKIEVEVKASDGPKTLPTRIVVRADGVRFGPEGTMITSGPLSFPIGTITSVAAVN